MILHYLHSAHIFVAYAVGGYPVFAAEKVGSFNIELVYVLALIVASACFATESVSLTVPMLTVSAITTS